MTLKRPRRYIRRNKGVKKLNPKNLGVRKQAGGPQTKIVAGGSQYDSQRGTSPSGTYSNLNAGQAQALLKTGAGGLSGKMDGTIPAGRKKPVGPGTGVNVPPGVNTGPKTTGEKAAQPYSPLEAAKAQRAKTIIASNIGAQDGSVVAHGYDERRSRRGTATTTTTTTSTSTLTTTTTCAPANRLLIIQSNHADTSTDITDVMGHNLTLNGSVQHDTAEARWCSSSILFEGTDDNIEVDDSPDWDFGTGDFTIEFWVKLNTINTVQMLCLRGDDGGIDGTSWKIWVDSSNIVHGWISDGSTAYQVDDSTAILTQEGPANYWYHVALIRATNTLEIRVLGLRGDFTDITGVTMLASSQKIYYGVRGTAGDEDFDGWLDEPIISNVARWSGFPPSGPPSGPECNLC